jgi:hypothetical protein
MRSRNLERLDYMLPRTLRDQIAELARRNDRSASAEVRRALQAHLGREEQLRAYEEAPTTRA